MANNDGKVHDAITQERLKKAILDSVKNSDLQDIAESAKVEVEKEDNPKSTQHLFPKELTKIFKTLGMHAPTGIRPPNAANHRALMNKKNKQRRASQRGR